LTEGRAVPSPPPSLPHRRASDGGSEGMAWSSDPAINLLNLAHATPRWRDTRQDHRYVTRRRGFGASPSGSGRQPSREANGGKR